MTAALEVIEPGLFVTLQDLGRVGSQALGMPVAGALDPLALRLANALAGNPQGTGALEIGFLGPTLRVAAESVRVAVVGPVQVTLGTDPAQAAKTLEPNRSHRLVRDQVLKVGFVSGAAYAYLAVEGGFDVGPFMDSVSTYTRASLGGFRGRKVAAGDSLPLTRRDAAERTELAAAAVLPYGEGPVRVVLGPQDDYFTAETIERFLHDEFVVTKEADRMGLRLDGPRLVHGKSADIVSDAIATGCIQVPGAGTPIVLLADHQTIGGYPKIASVISADLPRVGQLTPGQTLHFRAVTVDEGETLRRRQEEAFLRVLTTLAPARPPGGIDVDALHDANLIDGIVDALSHR